ncbi:methyltransferase [Candidatus Bathyarchaeota archaeon]|nr:methyltransferase [Candidatus Bathyarchaeota archaeon]
MGSMAEVYKPAEDTLLLLRHAERLVEGDVLEMGTGSGYIAIELSRLPRVRSVVGVDIDPKAVGMARNNALEAGVSDEVGFLESDLFQNLGDSRFNWILFNPPYLPSEGAIDELSWAGGGTGGELLMRFLSEAPPHLSPGGCILAVVSSQTNFDFEKAEQQYKTEVLEEVSLFFETLLCVVFVPSAFPEAEV